LPQSPQYGQQPAGQPQSLQYGQQPVGLPPWPPSAPNAPQPAAGRQSPPHGQQPAGQPQSPQYGQQPVGQPPWPPSAPNAPQPAAGRQSPPHGQQPVGQPRSSRYGGQQPVGQPQWPPSAPNAPRPTAGRQFPPHGQQPGRPSQPGPTNVFETLDIGHCISTTFLVTKERILLLWGIVLIGTIPDILGQMFLGQELGQDGFSGAPSTAGWLIAFLSGLLNICLEGAICFAVYRALRDEATTIGECLAKGLERLGGIILVGVLLSLLFGGFAMLASLVITVGTLVSKILGLLLTLGAVFVGVVIALELCLVIPVCVVERTGPKESFRRSAELVRGNLARIFAVLLLFGAIWVALAALSLVPLEMVEGPGAGHLLVYILTSAVERTAFVLAFVSLPVIYCHLRTVKENHSVIDEADVFD
jgi:hypothetical protein